MKLTAIVLLLFLISPPNEQYKLVSKIPLEGNLMTTDPLGNCYVVSKNRVYKYDKNGTLIKKYSNNNFAELASIDASNPYKILVFYQDFGKLLFLDNMLSDNGEPIDMMRSEFNQTTLAAHSFENGYWIYEPLLNELFKLSPGIDIIQQSGNLTRLLRQKINPNFLLEFNSRIYLNNPTTGILVFDQFGTYIKSIALKNLEHFQVKDDRIYFLKNQQLHTFYFQSLETDTTDLPIQENVKRIEVQKKRLYLLTNEALYIYQIN